MSRVPRAAREQYRYLLAMRSALEETRPNTDGLHCRWPGCEFRRPGDEVKRPHGVASGYSVECPLTEPPPNPVGQLGLSGYLRTEPKKEEP